MGVVVVTARSEDPDQRIYLGQRWTNVAELVDEPLPEGEPPPWPPRVSVNYYADATPSSMLLGADDYPGVTRNNYQEWAENDPCSDPRAWREQRTSRGIASTRAVNEVRLRDWVTEARADRAHRARRRDSFRRAAADWAKATRGIPTPREPDWE